MVINELTQQVLGNNTTRLNTPLLTQLGLFNQSQSDLATLQALASSVNGVVSMSPALSHQSPLQAAALHSASLQQAQQQLPTPLVQNFLSSLDLCQLNLPPNNSNVISKVPNVALNANLTAASSSAELAANATSIGVNNAATSNTFHVGNFPLLNTESKLLAQKNDLKCLASAALQQNIHQNFAHHSEATHLKTHQSPRDNSTIAAVIAEVAAAGASSSTPKKLAKPRNPRGNTTKKTTPVGKQDDPQKEDEIERQIKVNYLLLLKNS
jgi:hypothetical protein